MKMSSDLIGTADGKVLHIEHLVSRGKRKRLADGSLVLEVTMTSHVAEVIDWFEEDR